MLSVFLARWLKAASLLLGYSILGIGSAAHQRSPRTCIVNCHRGAAWLGSIRQQADHPRPLPANRTCFADRFFRAGPTPPEILLRFAAQGRWRSVSLPFLRRGQVPWPIPRFATGPFCFMTAPGPSWGGHGWRRNRGTPGPTATPPGFSGGPSGPSHCLCLGMRFLAMLPAEARTSSTHVPMASCGMRIWFFSGAEGRL